MQKMHIGYIALGSNLASATGTSLEICTQALGLFESSEMRIIKQSQWYSAPAFPKGSGPDYVNAVVEITTALAANAVLAALHNIEDTLGRTRPHRWASRVVDLDLLAFDQQIRPDRAGFNHWYTLPLSAQMQAAPKELILPHPRLQERAFVLVPLAEIAPEWRHPVLNKSATALLSALPADRAAEIRPL